MRRMMVLLAFAAILGIPSVFAQEPPGSKTWQIVVEADGRGEIEKLAVASNGDLLVAGFLDRAEPSVGGSRHDAWLARYSPDGRQLWSRRLGDEYRDEALDMAVSDDGSIIVAGWRDVQFTTPIQQSNGFAGKFTPDGELLWQVTFADPSRRISVSNALILDDGSILVAGQDEAEGCSGTRAFVAKVSADGRTEWMFNPPEYVAGVTPILENAIRVSSPGCPKRAMESARFGLIGVDGTIEVHVAQATFGFPEMFVARCAVVSLSAGRLVSEDCGPPLAPGYRPPDRYSGETVGGFANGDALIRQFDPSGREVWSRTLTSDGGDGVHAVAPTPDGGVVGAGFALAGPRVGRDNWDGLLVRLDSSGREVWRRKLGGDNRDELNGVAVLEDGSIVVAGYTGSQGSPDWMPWLMRLNAAGELDAQ